MPTLAKWGNSQGIRLPKELTDSLGLGIGDRIEAVVRNGEIVLRKEDDIPSLAELCARITPENRHEAIDWGPDVGNEIVIYEGPGPN